MLINVAIYYLFIQSKCAAIGNGLSDLGCIYMCVCMYVNIYVYIHSVEYYAAMKHIINVLRFAKRAYDIQTSGICRRISTVQNVGKERVKS